MSSCADLGLKCDFVPSGGFLVCTRCGVAGGANVSEETEYRVFGAEDVSKIRVAERSDDLLATLSTRIAPPSVAAAAQRRRAQQTQRRTRRSGRRPSLMLHGRIATDAQERQTKAAFERLDETCSQLGVLGASKQVAKALLKQFADAWFERQIGVRVLRAEMAAEVASSFCAAAAEADSFGEDDEDDGDDDDETAAAAMISPDGSLRTLSRDDLSIPTTPSPPPPPPKRARSEEEDADAVAKATENLRGLPLTPAFTAAVAYLALKRDGVPRTLREVASRTNVPLGELRKGFHLVAKFVHVLPEDRTEAASLVERICSRLGAPFSVASRARKLAAELSRTTLHGRSPTTVAIGAVYLSLDPNDSLSRDPSVLAAAASGNTAFVRKLLVQLESCRIVVGPALPMSPAPSKASTPNLFR